MRIAKPPNGATFGIWERRSVRSCDGVIAMVLRPKSIQAKVLARRGLRACKLALRRFESGHHQTFHRGWGAIPYIVPLG